MKVVLQRVKKASVRILQHGAEQTIGKGLVLLCAVLKNDTDRSIEKMADKCVNLRVFEDAQGKMNRSVLDVSGEVLAVSNFTVAGNAMRGRRPSYDDAERPEIALPKFQYFVDCLKKYGVPVRTGEFGAKMMVNIENDGPVTLVISTV